MFSRGRRACGARLAIEVRVRLADRLLHVHAELARRCRGSRRSGLRSRSSRRSACGRGRLRRRGCARPRGTSGSGRPACSRGSRRAGWRSSKLSTPVCTSSRDFTPPSIDIGPLYVAIEYLPNLRTRSSEPLRAQLAAAVEDDVVLERLGIEPLRRRCSCSLRTSSLRSLRANLTSISWAMRGWLSCRRQPVTSTSRQAASCPR